MSFSSVFYKKKHQFTEEELVPKVRSFCNVKCLASTFINIKHNPGNWLQKKYKKVKKRMSNSLSPKTCHEPRG